MSNYYTGEKLGTSITYNQEDIPSNLSLDQWDTITNITGKSTLLVCIGDSWTWGDSLTPTLAEHGLTDPIMLKNNWDYSTRKELCYGSHLSKHLDADWINYAFPGYSNIYILERFAHILNSTLIESYDQVYFVLCLTETGREYGWLPVPDPIPDCTSCKFLEKLEHWLIESLYQQYGDRDLSKLIVCRNFTKSFDSSEYHTKDLKTWIEINWENDQTTHNIDDIKVTGPTTQMGIKPIWFLESYDDYVARNYQKISSLYGFLEQSKYHSNKATKHPTAESHQLWADYLAHEFSRLR